MKKLLFCAICGLLWAACGADGDHSAQGDTPRPDAGAPADDAGVPPDCYPAPKTHLEIINACTDAERIDAKPVLPLLTADGGLPPLP